MRDLKDATVVVTGASSGIGAACARIFAQAGCRLAVVARRADRLRELREELTSAGAPAVHTQALDVRDSEAVQRWADGLEPPFDAVEVLVNNAGLSRGLDPLQSGDLADWEEMIDTNVKGLLYVDRALTPGMVARGSGVVVHIGSIAGRQVYPAGNVYCATKHAVRALTDGLRVDLLGTGVRVTSIDPGLVETEFSSVRFHGDEDRARAVYRGMTPLSARDVAEVVYFAATRPAHVALAECLVLPADQASALHVHRDS